MKKKFRVEGVDCADCAAKMEEGIKKIDGVKSAKINFLTEKLTIEADDMKFDQIIKLAEAEMDKVDSGARIIR
ncbi:cation transporter [Alterileibacterium massiliense]|uniref:cation transporter n=1 Tax=Alterileibacterium massiliense TaxID=1870997 RepID=UPI0008D98858|nr:cation transporter [Alterileibacterium massiliense]